MWISLGMAYRFVPQVLVLVLCFIALLMFVIADYKSGIFKAKSIGEAITSEKRRRTVNKLVRYFTLMFAFAALDLTQMVCIHIINVENEKHFFVVPIFTMLATIFLCFVEFKSVREKATEKQRRLEHEAIKDIDNIVNYVIAKKKELNNNESFSYE